MWWALADHGEIFASGAGTHEGVDAGSKDSDADLVIHWCGKVDEGVGRG
jgi:hypothetical protein